MNVFNIFNTLIMIGIVASAVCAISFKKMLSSALALGVTGTFIALEFLLLQAPDVAIAEAAVGAVLTTALFVIAIAKTTRKEDEEK